MHEFPAVNICMEPADKLSFAPLYKAGEIFLENIFSKVLH